MHPTFRIVALTAALAALSSVASAAEVRLNFNDLGTQAETAGAPVAVPDTQGLRFRGAFGYGVGMLGSDDPENLDMVSAGKGGFLLNKQRGASTTDIILSLVQSPAITRSADPVVFFQSITFNLFTKGTGAANKLYATGANGEDQGRQMTSGGGDTWTSLPTTYTFDPLAQVTSLRFTAGGAAFALDDMVIALSSAPGPGGNVPEPASYGLAGLALLAAGAASRRKQRG